VARSRSRVCAADGRDRDRAARLLRLSHGVCRDHTLHSRCVGRTECVTAQPALAGGVTAALVGGARTAGLLLAADGLGAVVAVMVVVDALTDAPGSTCSTALVVPAGGGAVSVVVTVVVSVAVTVGVVVTVTVTVVVVSGAVVVGEEVAVVEAAAELLPELSLPELPLLELPLLELPLFESSSDPSLLDELESAPTVPVAVAVSVLDAATVASAAVAVADGLDVGVTVAEALVVATDVEPDDVEPDDVPARTPPVALWVGVPVSIGIAARASAAASNCSSGMQSVAA